LSPGVSLLPSANPEVACLPLWVGHGVLGRAVQALTCRPAPAPRVVCTGERSQLHKSHALRACCGQAAWPVRPWDLSAPGKAVPCTGVTEQALVTIARGCRAGRVAGFRPGLRLWLLGLTNPSVQAWMGPRPPVSPDGETSRAQHLGRWEEDVSRI
jgi:hypothetical protein